MGVISIPRYGSRWPKRGTEDSGESRRYHDEFLPPSVPFLPLVFLPPPPPVAV